MIRRPPRSTHCISSAASDVYKRQTQHNARDNDPENDGGKSGSNTLTTGIGVKYFMGKSKFFFSPSLDFGMGFSTDKKENLNSGGGYDYEKDGTSTSIMIGITPEFTYFFNSNWSGSLGFGNIGYKSTTRKDENGDKKGSNGAMEFKADLTAVNIGVSYWFK